MRTPARWLRAAALSAAAGLLVPALLGSAPSATAVAAGSTTTLTPGVLSLSAAEIANPLRGQYTWMGQAPQPATWPAPDRYDRDTTYWGRIEPTRGHYDFTAIEDGLEAAGAAKGKYGFRVMAYCPGCWMDGRNGWPSVVPSWIPKDAQGVPSWNSETFLSGWEELWAELGRRYGDDPRLGYVDVGGYGNAGEWITPANRTFITEPNATRLIDAVADAFPTKHVLASSVMVYTKPTTLQSALDAHRNLGLRSDCLGKSDWQKPEGTFSSVWKSRPFFTEWCTTGDPQTALTQVTGYHVSTVGSGNHRLLYSDMTPTQRVAYTTLVKQSGYRYAVSRATISPITPGQPFTVGLTLANYGVAPTYDRWKVRVVLKNAGGSKVATLPLTLDLRGRLPGSSMFSQTITAPSSLAAMSYDLALEVVDPEEYSSPMRLANTNRDADGSYVLGSVTVGDGSADPVTRVAADDRYSASAWISAQTFAPGVPVAYVATGEKFPDALSGAPAGGYRGGPVLLVRSDSIPDAIADELTRLRPERIVILSGTASVSTQVGRDLRAYSPSVTRVAADDRYSASAWISAQTFAPGVPVAYVATGEKFPDALSGAPAGGYRGGPVLLVRSDSIPDAIADELTRLRPERIVILSGTASVSTQVGRDLRAYSPSVTRVEGTTRYDASAWISAQTFTPGVEVAYVATGEKFPDALSGAPAGGYRGGPVLLVRSDSIPDAIADELTRLRPQRIVLLSGTASVSTSVQRQLEAYAVPVP